MTDKENPLLKKIRLPGKRFRLPSRGLFYTDDELDENVIDGEIEIFSMTTVDEITLRSPEFLFNGQAIERVFNRCVPEIKKPLRLLAKDVDYVLTCLRVVSYGGTYQINTRCPECEERQNQDNKRKTDDFIVEVKTKAKEQEVDFELAMLDDKVQRRLEIIGNKRSDEQTYNINLEGILQNNTTEISDEEFTKYDIILSNEQKVRLAPMKMDSAVATHQFQNEANTLDLNGIEEFVSFMIASTILQIDDITDWDMICEWAKVLPLDLKREMENTTMKLKSWGTDFTYNVRCQNEECNHERNINTLLNPITFFMTPSGSEEPSN